MTLLEHEFERKRAALQTISRDLLRLEREAQANDQPLLAFMLAQAQLEAANQLSALTLEQHSKATGRPDARDARD